MGLFAVLSATEKPSLSIDRCHINVWLLPGLLGHTVLFWDIGLEVKANSDVKTIRMALPFRTEVSTVTDLGAVIRDPDIANLIFGDAIVSGNSVRVNDEAQGFTLELHRTDAAAAKHVDDLSTDEFTVCDIGLNKTLHANESGYIRLRFVVAHPGRLWIWRRFGPFRTGALVDLRVNDLREAVAARVRDKLQGHVLPIGKLYVFVIVPWRLREVMHSPVFRYVRVLEGRAWQRYLGWSTGLLRPAKLIIYAWNWNTVDSSPPARAFLRFSDDRPGPSGPAYGGLLLCVFIVAVLADAVVKNWAGWPTFAIAPIDLGFSATVVSVVVVISALLEIALRLPGLGKSVARPIRWAAAGLEILFYRRALSSPN